MKAYSNVYLSFFIAVVLLFIVLFLLQEKYIWLTEKLKINTFD